MAAVTYLFLFYFYIFVESVPVDVALHRPMTAYITCGSFGPEEFISQMFLWSSGDVRLNNTRICYNDSLYPPSAMVDGEDNTWWQSTARPNFNQTAGGPEVTMNVDLQQVFEIQSIVMKMGESLRPRRIVIYKSSTDATFLQPWIYRVQSEQNCTKLYNTPSGINNVVSVDSKLCQIYLTGPQALNELVTFDLTQVTVANWRNGRFLRIEYYDIDLALGIVGIPFQHYTVRTLNVMAECTCNGQQVACSQSNITGTFECVCGNYTQGTNCESCLPFYNQYDYRYGIACEACNCFNHSDVCVFDQNVASTGGSINSKGVRSGGGVCQNCRDNTAGVNCEQCLPLFYRPLGVLQMSTIPCVSCNCSGPGMQVTGLMGDCVMNENVSSNGMLPGDCYCKKNVAGRYCDRCRDGTYNMVPLNPDGCQDCGCNTNGTVGSSIVCDVNGQCNCKQFVTNSRCDTCKDGYYGLNSTKLDGCTVCQCDVGGSLPSGCSKDVGACTCRPGVTSISCNTPEYGYYYPDLHFIFSEFENIRAPWDTAQAGYFGFGYVTTSPQRPLSAVLTPPLMSSFSDQYQMVIRYSSAAGGSGTISVAGLDKITTNTLNMTFPSCPPPQWCYAALGILALPKGLGSTVTVTVQGPADPRLLLDRIVAIPVEYLNTTNLFGASEDAKFQTTCQVVNNGVMSAGANQQYCMSKVFSLGIYYLNGALPCNCNFLGSFSNGTCQVYGGQCPCKPGTTGRQCDMCQIQFYGMTDQGCRACNCSNTAFKACDDLGLCLCPPGVEGASCERCKDTYYNYDYNRGCTPCDCNNIGSWSLSCNSTNGVCSCRPGVIGSRCDQCADGFWQMSYAGCLPCSCDADGSTGQICDKITGQCPCKKNVQNQQCTVCNSTAFAKSPSHVEGCLSCVCMGITNICQSAITFFQQTTPIIPLFNTSQSNPVPLISVVTATLGPVTNKINHQVIDGTDMAEIPVQGSQVLYWQAPGLSGNLLKYYEGKVSFVVQWLSSEPGIFPLTNVKLLLIGRNNVQLSFLLPVPSVLQNTMTSIDVILSLESVIAAGQTTVSRGQLLVAITQTQAVLIPASYASQNHVSRIGNVTYTMNPTNVEQCFCPPGYEGLSCENCSTGFMKTNITTQGYLGNCIPCSCNFHSQLCIPDTGQCMNCMDNTAGFNCELCADGYYRDSSLGPMSPCMVCPCYMPRVSNTSCAIINSTVTCLQCNSGYTGAQCDSCLPFYYGHPEQQFVGTCTACNCSGNTNSCNSQTGQCLNCSYSTDGFNCEKCIDGFFGIASMQNCSACGCNMTGSVSPICNNQTGQCPCISGVGHRTCDSCLDYYYHPSNDTAFKGCIPCNCNTFGSANLSCDASGRCPCKTFTQGTVCDSCTPTYWGLPQQPCQSCNCNAVGTYLSNVSLCNSLTGQCACRPGVGRRQCDDCLPMYFNMSIDGCTACGICETSLGNDTMALLKKFQDYWNKTLTFQQIQQQDAILLDLQGMITSAFNETGLSGGQDIMASLNALVQQLLQSANVYITDFTALEQTIADIFIRSTQLLNDTSTQYLRVNSIKTGADKVRVDTGTQYMNVQNYVQTLQGYNASASQLLLTLQAQPQNNTWVWNGLFDVEYQQTQDELSRSRATLSAAQQFNNTITTQGSRTNGLQTILRQIGDSFLSLNNAIAGLNTNALSIIAKLSAVMTKYNITMTNKLAADNLWVSVQSIISTTSLILNQGQNSLTTAQQLVADCRTIIDGISTGILPINTTVDLTGITGWNQAYNLVVLQLQSISAMIANYTVSVGLAERKANDLTQQAQNILNTFQSVQSRGQPAVDAINGLERVVNLLDQALQMALSANNAIQQILSQLQSVSIQNIETSANQSLSASVAIKQSLDLLMANVSIIGLNSQLDVANASLQQAIQSWNQLLTRIANFNAALANLQNVASNVSLDGDLNAGNAACDAALQKLMDVASQTNQLQQTVASQANIIATLASDVANTSLMQSQLSANLSAFRNQLSNINQAVIYSINSSESDIITFQPVLLQVFDSLMMKLAAVQAKMAALEQPVSFTGTSFETITNPDSGVSRLYNSVGLDFNPTQLRGVLLFAENNSTGEKVLIQLVNSSVCFEYSNVDVTNTAVSPATIEIGVWYRVYATRYGFDGQLTVIRMNTGGTAVTPMRTVSTINPQLTLSSPLYIGGLLLSNENLPKVYESGIPFSGCIYNIIYNGAPVPLWQNILRKDSQATCCRKPAPIPSSPTISPCVTLYGFGFIKYLPRSTFSVTTQAQVAMQFRTFGPDGIILMISSPTTSDYYSIYMSGGTVVFAVSSSNNVMSVQSSNLYNDGQWYQLRAVHNPLSIQLTIIRVNQTVASQPEVKQLGNLNYNLASLVNLGFTIGGQNPDVIRGPVTTSFAGCLQDFQHSNALTSSMDLQPDSFTSGVNASTAVDLTKCYASVISGLGFLNTSSFASLMSIVSPIQTMSFEILTTAPSGVIAYVQLPQNIMQTNLFLYIALYNGDMFIVFNQGQGVQPAFRSRGNYLSDGMIHRIALDFSFTNSPRMTIDTSETHVGAITMSPYFSLLGNSIYVGGVPSAIGIDSSYCPVRSSLVGGIRNLQINSGLINFFNPNIISGNNVQGIYLSGLPTPPSILPPLPFTTITPPTTTLPPSCTLPRAFSYMNNSYLNFAGTLDSYVSYSSVGLETVLENAFSVRLSFRSLQANGILLYTGGSSAAPTNYFGIYMYAGYLRASMSTNTSAIQTKNLQSLYTYNDGKWHEVEVLRVNDFLAVIVAENKDYINNQVSSIPVTKLAIGTSIYLGGVPSTFAGPGYPFDSNNIVVGVKSFQGCVSNVSLIQYALHVTVLDPSRELQRQAVTLCQTNVTSGMFMNSTTGYIRVGDSINVAPSFNLVPNFVFNMTFRSSAQTGTLMTAWSSTTRFVALVLTLGQVRVIMSSATDGQFFSVSSRAQPSPLSICDNNPHTVVFTISNYFVTLQIDTYAVETFQFAGFTYNAPLSVPIYIGGVKDASWSVPSIFTPVTFSGCIQSININGQPYFISESTDVQQATSGCPI